MRAFVFTDTSLKRQAGRYVWLDLDTEKAKNAPVRKRLQIAALPTYFIIDPATEKPVTRWVGGASVTQLHKILDDGYTLVNGQGPTGPADDAFARGERLYGEADYAAAAAAYEEALAAAPSDWPRYGRTVESLLFSLTQSDSMERAALLAREAYPRLRQTTSSANVAAVGLDAAVSLSAEHPRRQELIALHEAACREVLADTTLALAGDDRSGVYITLIGARRDAKDEAGAQQLAREWSQFLDHEAARAKTPEERATYDSHRLSAYIEIGQPERAIPMLEVSERDFPDDYNPPARMASAYRAMKRWDEALACSDRALTKAYGPRKILLLQTRADIHVGRGDTPAARKTLEEAVALAESLPPGQRSERTIAALKKKLESVQ